MSDSLRSGSIRLFISIIVSVFFGATVGVAQIRVLTFSGVNSSDPSDTVTGTARYDLSAPVDDSSGVTSFYPIESFEVTYNGRTSLHTLENANNEHHFSVTNQPEGRTMEIINVISNLQSETLEEQHQERFMLSFRNRPSRFVLADQSHPETITLEDWASAFFYVTDTRRARVGENSWELVSEFYGNYNLTSVTIEEDVQSPGNQVAEVLSSIVDLIDAGIAPQAAKSFGKALDALTAALDPSLWADGEFSTPAAGEEKEVFKQLEKATKELLKAAKDDSAANLLAEVVALASQSMAVAAVESIVDAKDRAKAEKELTKANEALAKGDFDKAVDNYGKALNRSTK